MAATANPDKSGAASAPRLTVTRRFNCTPERLFDAWFDPAAVGSWLFATPSGEMRRVEIDARPGGRFRIDEQRGDQLAEHAGRYLEIDRPRRLVFDFSAGPDSAPSRVTVMITPDGAGSVLTLTHDLDAAWADHADRVRGGWSMILDGLEGCLAQGRLLVMTRRLAAPRQLVWRAWTDPVHFARWFGPRAIAIPDCRIDPRPGGAITFVHALPEIGDLWIQGSFQDIVEPERLAFILGFINGAGAPAIHPMFPDWPLETRFLTRVTLAEDGRGTLMRIEQEILPAAAAASPAITRERRLARQGWAESLERLDELAMTLS